MNYTLSASIAFGIMVISFLMLVGNVFVRDRAWFNGVTRPLLLAFVYAVLLAAAIWFIVYNRTHPVLLP